MPVSRPIQSTTSSEFQPDPRKKMPLPKPKPSLAVHDKFAHAHHIDLPKYSNNVPRKLTHHPYRPQNEEQRLQAKKQACTSAKPRFGYYLSSDSIYFNYVVPTLPTFLNQESTKKDETGNCIEVNGVEIV